MEKPFVLKGGTLVDPAQDINRCCDLLVEEGKVRDIASALDVSDEYASIIDVSGKYIVPGMVDMHVHLRDPGEENKETVADGAAAAVAGGVTSLCCMPNTNPPVDNSLVVESIQEKARRANLAHVYPLGTLTRGRCGKEMSDYASLLAAGVRGFSDDGSYVESSALMLNILDYLTQFDAVAISHCEDAGLTGSGVAHDGYYAHMLGLPGIPAVSETVAVARDLQLAQATGGSVHIAHVSCADSVDLIRKAKEQGVQVTAEVAPHHLFLTHAALQGFNSMAKMKPPLRTEEDRRSLWDGLREGVIDIIATDHAPHSRNDKDCTFADASFGVVSLDFVVSLLLTEMVHTGKFGLKELVEFYSHRPARILGLPAGSLPKGAPADIVVLDLDAPVEVKGENFYSRGSNTPFMGRSLQGKPVMTFVAGELKMQDGKVKE